MEKYRNFKHIKINNFSFNDLDVYKFYLGSFSIGESLYSPFRKERTPSFYIFKGSDGSYKWKDFGKSDTSGGGTIKLVMELFGLSYESAKQKISNDLSGLSAFIGIPNRDFRDLSKMQKKETEIKIKTRPFSTLDLEYWQQFGINKLILEKFEVFSVSTFWVNENIFNVSYKKLCFAYHFDGKFRIYMPDSEKCKWINNCNESIIQGCNQITDKSDLLLIITKSLKDIMTLYSLGYNAIAPQSETVVFNENVIDSLYNKFDNIITLFDNDSTGVSLAENYKKKYDISPIFVPDKNIKDISDYYKLKGKERTIELLKQLI